MSRLRVFWFSLLMAAVPVAVVAQGPVGRISEASGPVSLRPPGGGWAAVARGGALSEGQTVRTGPRSQAELDLGVNRIGMDPDTVLRIDSAHPATPAVTLEQGRVMLLVRSLQAGQVGRVLLARGSVTLAGPGLYVIEVGEAGGAATVGVSRGLAQIYGPGVSVRVTAGQTWVIGRADGGPGSLRAGVADGFLADDSSIPAMPQVVRPDWQAPVPGPLVASPIGVPMEEVAGLPGGEALLRDGSWGSVPEHGQVWYPPVAVGWSPYADAWGDYRPWGYTPWHYGTWIQIGPRWGWVPPRRHHVPEYVHRGGQPPPAVAQPHRAPPAFVQPQGFGGGYPRHPVPVVGGPVVGGPVVGGPVVGRPVPPAPQGYAPRSGGGSPWPQVSAPQVSGPQVSAPQVSGPRPASAPPVATAPVYAPRPAPPVYAAPQPAPRTAAPAPSRRCAPGQPWC